MVSGWDKIKLPRRGGGEEGINWERGKEGMVREGERLTAGNYEDGIAQPDDGEVPQILVVDGVATDAEEGEPEGQAVDCEKEELADHHSVDEADEKLLGGDCVLLYELRKVVKARCCGGGLVSCGCMDFEVGRRCIPIARVRKPKPRRSPR